MFAQLSVTPRRVDCAPVSQRLWGAWNAVRGGRKMQFECIYSLCSLLGSQAAFCISVFQQVCSLTLGAIVLNTTRNLPHNQDRQGENKHDRLALICKFPLKC